MGPERLSEAPDKTYPCHRVPDEIPEYSALRNCSKAFRFPDLPPRKILWIQKYLRFPGRPGGSNDANRSDGCLPEGGGPRALSPRRIGPLQTRWPNGAHPFAFPRASEVHSSLLQRRV